MKFELLLFVNCYLLATVLQLNVHRKLPLGWRDGSVVKSNVYSSRGSEFNSKEPYGSSQPGNGHLMPPSGVSEDSNSVPIYMN